MTPIFYKSILIRFFSVLGLALMCQTAAADMQPIEKSTTVEALGGIAVEDMLPPDMVDENVNPMMEVHGSSVSLAFTDYRPLEERSITVYFSTSPAEMERFSGGKGLETIAGIHCRKTDAMFAVELHCRLNNLVITLTAPVKVAGDEDSKQETWGALSAYLETFPLDQIAAAQHAAGIVAIAAPDPQQGAQMRVPGLKGGTLGDVLPASMASGPIYVTFSPQSVGFMITVKGYDLPTDDGDKPVELFFGNREKSADQFFANYEKTGDAPVEIRYRDALRRDIDSIPCFSSVGTKDIQLECLAGRVVIVLTQSGLDDNPEAIADGSALDKLMTFAKQIPFQAISTIELE